MMLLLCVLCLCVYALLCGVVYIVVDDCCVLCPCVLFKMCLFVLWVIYCVVLYMCLTFCLIACAD